MVLSGSLLISGSILPNVASGSTTSSFDLGSPTAAWKDIYVSNGTINFLDGAGNTTQTIGTGNNQFTGTTFITGSLLISGSISVNGRRDYVAKITQLTTAAPTSSVYENTLGGNLVWTRVATGSYQGTLAGTFSSGKVHLLCNNPLSTRTVYLYNAGDPNKIYIDSVDIATGLPADYDSDSLDIEIKVYP